MPEQQGRQSRQGKTERKSGASASVAMVEQNVEQAQMRPEVDVGLRLRQLRNDHKLSIRSLAAASGLSVNTLSLIETGKSSPSVSTLQRVAAALSIPITSFFESSTASNSIAFVKAGQRPRASFTHGWLEELGKGMAAGALQPFLVTIESDSGSGPHDIVHTGFEFVYCLSGRLTYVIDEQTFHLEAGDSLLFESHLPHRWHNTESEPSQALLILAPADLRDHPTTRHFSVGVISTDVSRDLHNE